MKRVDHVWALLATTGVVRPETSVLVRRRVDASAAVLGLVVLVAASLAVRDGTVGGAEQNLFHAINGLPDVLEWPMWVAQLLGLLVTPLLFAVAALVVGRRALALGLAALVPLKLLLERDVVKQLVERERPGTTVPDAIIRDAAVAGLSFPSGHAVFAFAIAGLVGPYLTRRWEVVLYVLATLNGVARIYLGAHNPLDIVGGAALGVALAATINLSLGVPRTKPDTANAV